MAIAPSDSPARVRAGVDIGGTAAESEYRVVLRALAAPGALVRVRNDYEVDEVATARRRRTDPRTR